MTGYDLANPAGQETDILLVIGTLAVTGTVERFGYQHLVTVGTAVLPPGSETILAGRVTPLKGRIIYSAARPREFTGRDTFGSGFFESLDDPVLLTITGHCTLEEDVTPELLKEKVAGIILTGTLVAPRAIVGLVQALTFDKTGTIVSSDDPRAAEPRLSERERERNEDRG